MTFEAWLAAKGFGDGSGLNETQRASLMAAWKAEITAAATPPPNVTARERMERDMEEARKEQDRANQIADIVARCAKEHPVRLEEIHEDGRVAIEAKTSSQEFELYMLRKLRPTAPGIAARFEKALADDVIEAAVCRAGGLQGIDKFFDERTLEASHKHFRNGLGLCDVLMTYARRAGYSGTSVKANLQGALRAAFGADLRAAGSWGPSTGGGLSGVLSNTANKFLRAGFDSVDPAWRSIAATRSVNDFKAITTYSLTGSMTYEKLPPGGEIEHATLGAETYTNQADTYARMIGLDRRDIINDDLGALTNVARRLGRGGALKINDVFWTIFLNNSSFFTAGRNNVSTGAGSALSLAGLDAANQKFALQTDPDGLPIATKPAILLVPPALEATAKTLMSSTGLTIGSGTAAQGSSNIWASMFRVVSSAYMQNSSYTGNSAAAWYLLADPSDVPVIEGVFLNGVESPTVESADADFGMLGIAWRGYHDFGFAFQEYRGGVRSAGS